MSAGTSSAAVDPGVRPGADAGPSHPVPNLQGFEATAFGVAQTFFEEVDSVRGDVPGEPDAGLGPTFNMNSCSGCHAFPASGGSSPRVNPQIALATLHGARNTVPSFLREGPVREVRFKKNADGTPDGGVHSLFVITGRSDAPAGFNLRQTDFSNTANISFRIPTPTFGGGLIEAIPDATIVSNLTVNVPGAPSKASLGITGKINRSGNDGTVTRFGWKAQNKSLLMFAGEAYNAEQGVTNDLFPNARELDGQSLGAAAGQPESTVDLATGGIGDIEQFMIFMRLLDQPTPRNPSGVSNASVAAGRASFTSIGCVQCHTPSLRTGVSSVAALSNKTANLFSDLAVHALGYKTADDVSQGAANGQEFRTAPLWGLGQRLFLLHDGRTGDLETAIRLHQAEGVTIGDTTYAPSEANAVIDNFINLPDNQKQDLFNFLRSL